MLRTIVLYLACFGVFALFLLGLFMSIPGVAGQLWDGVEAILSGRYR